MKKPLQKKPRESCEKSKTNPQKAQRAVSGHTESARASKKMKEERKSAEKKAFIIIEVLK